MQVYRVTYNGIFPLMIELKNGFDLINYDLILKPLTFNKMMLYLSILTLLLNHNSTSGRGFRPLSLQNQTAPLIQHHGQYILFYSLNKSRSQCWHRNSLNNLKSGRQRRRTACTYLIRREGSWAASSRSP